MKTSNNRRIVVTGGCGYVGTILVPKLVARGYHVTVLDSMMFGNHLKPAGNLEVVRGDIRDAARVDALVSGATDVIHLASIANDPSSDLDPALTHSVNRDAVAQLVKAARKRGVGRFINASSSSVYGVKEEENVTEDLSLEPITLYARLKAETEGIIAAENSKTFATVSVRSATVCGPSARMRFDVIVNIMTKAAVVDRKIVVNGGGQYRPNIHIDDITDLYCLLVELPAEKVSDKIYNVGSTNHTVMEIAQMVRAETGAPVQVDANSIDNRSYRISSEKIKRELGFETTRTIQDAVRDMKVWFDRGLFGDPNRSIYYNVRTMKERMVK